jgi:hypothetical protein
LYNYCYYCYYYVSMYVSKYVRTEANACLSSEHISYWYPHVLPLYGAIHEGPRQRVVTIT